jgi:hypothetical protein
VLHAVLASFANDSTELFPGSQLVGEGDDRTLVIPAMTGADIRTFGRISASSVNTDASGHGAPLAGDPHARPQRLDRDRAVGQRATDPARRAGTRPT